MVEDNLSLLGSVLHFQQQMQEKSCMAEDNLSHLGLKTGRNGNILKNNTRVSTILIVLEGKELQIVELFAYHCYIADKQGERVLNQC